MKIQIKKKDKIIKELEYKHSVYSTDLTKDLVNTLKETKETFTDIKLEIIIDIDSLIGDYPK